MVEEVLAPELMVLPSSTSMIQGARHAAVRSALQKAHRSSQCLLYLSVSDLAESGRSSLSTWTCRYILFPLQSTGPVILYRIAAWPTPSTSRMDSA